MSFKESVEKERKLLIPMFEDAIEARELYHEKNTLAYRRNGQPYKIPFDPQKSMDLLNSKIDLVFSYMKPAINDLYLGNSNYLSRVFAFLSIKEKVYGSGYLKEDICKLLKHIQLTEEQKYILGEIMLMNVEFAAREIKWIVKLIPIINKEQIKDSIYQLGQSENRVVKQRAERIIKEYYQER